MRVFLAFLALFLPSLLSADIGISARTAALFPEDAKMRAIYSEAWADFGLEIYANFCSPWRIFNDVNYEWAKGKSSCLGERTQLFLWSDHMGVEYYLLCCDVFRAYAGLGVGFAHVHFHDHASKHIKQTGPSLAVKSGIEFPLFDRFFVDFFADYTHHWIHFKSHHVRTGGFKLGIGLGILL